jgi:hypothetical protein
MRHIKLFESFEDDGEKNLLDDYLLEYLDKWNLIDQDRYYSLKSYEKPNYNGTYKIEKFSTKYFNVAGFPHGESGYRIKICFYKEIDEKDFKLDMYKFINRVKKLGYDSDTFRDKYSDNLDIFYIAFFNRNLIYNQ